jgi:hypothetical protein
MPRFRALFRSRKGTSVNVASAALGLIPAFSVTLNLFKRMEN